MDSCNILLGMSQRFACHRSQINLSLNEYLDYVEVLVAYQALDDMNSRMSNGCLGQTACPGSVGVLVNQCTYTWYTAKKIKQI